MKTYSKLILGVRFSYHRRGLCHMARLIRNITGGEDSQELCSLFTDDLS